jgi:hypothetical protein
MCRLTITRCIVFRRSCPTENFFGGENRVASSRVFGLDDPSACQAIFPSADVELFPTAKGNFHAEITQVGMNGLWMHRIHISLPEINTVAIKPGRRSIGFVTECSSSSLLDCGLEVRPGDVVINRSDVVHQRSDAASALSGATRCRRSNANGNRSIASPQARSWRCGGTASRRSMPATPRQRCGRGTLEMNQFKYGKHVS